MNTARRLPRLDLGGLLRVSVYFSVLGCVSAWLLLRTARAEAEERVTELGSKLVASLGPELLGEPHEMLINGQRMFIASRVTPLAVGAVLDRLEAYCHEHSGDLGRAIGELPASFEGKPVPRSLRDPAAWMTARGSDDAESFGQVACLTRSDSMLDLAARLGAFVDSGDLSQLGDLRYFVARRDEHGQTHLLSTWTEGRFDVLAMLPEHGDAPGRDARDAPRPPQGARKLSAELSGQPYAVRVYESPTRPDELLAFYDAEMARRGFSAEPVGLPGGSEPSTRPDIARVFSKDGALLLVAAVEVASQRELTQLSIVEMGTRGKLRVAVPDAP